MPWYLMNTELLSLHSFDFSNCLEFYTCVCCFCDSIAIGQEGGVAPLIALARSDAEVISYSGYIIGSFWIILYVIQVFYLYSQSSDPRVIIWLRLTVIKW